FRNDVMAVLSRAGCNMGACHGNLHGKGGVKLSLRGQDPDLDLAALTREALGRRVDTLRPQARPLLPKATPTVPPEGAQRFGRDSLEYQLLRRWIAEGARPDRPGTPTVKRLDVTPRERVLVEPDDRVALKVTATFSDGSKRDVTRLAVFDPSNLGV